MIRAVLWKEWREQAAIIVALLALGSGVIAAAVEFGSPIRDADPLDLRAYEQAGRLAFLMLALTAGTVIGGALFAGEDEAGTTAYLETLPASRWRLWRGKLAAGLVLAVGAGAVLIAAGLALGALGSGRSAVKWAAWSAVLVLAAFGWGVFGSVLSRSTLTACGIGAIAAPFAGGFFLVLANVGFAAFEDGYERQSHHRRAELTVQSVAFLLLTVPVVLSGLIYSAPDRARRAVELTPGTVAGTRSAVREVGRRRSGFGVRALAWLLVRQYLVPALVLGGLALTFGLVMLMEIAPMVVGWPSATLFLGALVGVIGWSDEQGKGASRFWGERRLPVGRLWFAKLVFGLGLTLLLSAVYLAPVVVRDAVTGDVNAPLIVGAFRSGLFLGDLGLWSGRTPDSSNFLYFVFLWPVYGFAAGHLAGMLFKKAVVAAGVAVITGGTLAALWLPSLLAGGLHHWQLWPVPVIAVLTARLLVRPWSADRVGTRRPVAVLATGVTLAVGLTAAGIGYRVAEVPVISEAEDDLKFAATVPGFEQNEAGREIRAAVGRYQSVARELLMRGPVEPLYPDAERSRFGGAFGQSYPTQFEAVGKYGWPHDRPDAAAWLDEVFAPRWDEPLVVAAGKPLGVLEDPTTVSLTGLLGLEQTRNELSDSLHRMPALLLARGLQKQAAGDPAAFVRYLDAVLALTRNARNKTLPVWVGIARRADVLVLKALDRWLERLDGRPDLLRQALDALARHEATVPTDPADGWLAQRVVIRSGVTAPSAWAERFLTIGIGEVIRPRARDAEAIKARAELEANLLGFAWAVPWERERLRRVVGLGNDSKRAAVVDDLTRGAPGLFQVAVPGFGFNDESDTAGRRAAVLRVALRLYEAEVGKRPENLSELVGRKYLPVVPVDPFDGKPFRYRVSNGERIELEVVYTPQAAGWPEARPTGPGWVEGQWLPDRLEVELDATAAVAGGHVWYYRQRNLSQGEFDAMAAAMGGLVRFPRLLPRAPGVELPSIRDDGFDAVGAVAGGVVQWPLPPLLPVEFWPDSGSGLPWDPAAGRTDVGIIEGRLSPDFESPVGVTSGRREPPPALKTERRETADVAAGQGVLWSVGPDGTDDGGKDLAVGSYRSRPPGDLIYVVPLPAGKPTVPPKKEMDR